MACRQLAQLPDPSVVRPDGIRLVNAEPSPRSAPDYQQPSLFVSLSAATLFLRGHPIKGDNGGVKIRASEARLRVPARTGRRVSIRTPGSVVIPAFYFIHKGITFIIADRTQTF